MISTNCIGANEEERIFDWGIKRVLMENVMFEMDFEIWLEFGEKKLQKTGKIETNVVWVPLFSGDVKDNICK